MNKEMLERVLTDLNALIADEVTSTVPGHYKRVMKLAAYAERIKQMDNMRVAGVTDRNGRPARHHHPVGVPYWRPDDHDPIDAQIDMEANAEEGGVGPYQNLMGGGLGGLINNFQHEDQADLTREAIMTAREANAAKAPTAGKLADELSSLLDVEERLVKLPEDSPERAALQPIRDNIKAVTAKLEKLAKASATTTKIVTQTQPQGFEVEHVHPAVAHSIVLRRHPPDLDVGGDVHADRREADREGAGGAGGPPAEGPREGVDLA